LALPHTPSAFLFSLQETSVPPLLPLHIQLQFVPLSMTDDALPEVHSVPEGAV
jgi:hypothetical protein